jgi:hypothetical protein
MINSRQWRPEVSDLLAADVFRIWEDVAMKRIVLMALLALALPMAAFAGAVDFSNAGGTLTGSSSGLVLTGSTLIGVDGFNGMGQLTGALGSVNFSTGAYVSTSGSGVGSVATFNGGGTFQISGNGSYGIPNGVIFSGSFTGPVTLTETAMNSSTGGNTYLLSGQVSGTWYNGSTVSGATSQIYIFTGKNGWMGTSTLGSGDTIISTVPEPGTLGLLGTGLFGLAGIVRKKLKA